MLARWSVAWWLWLWAVRDLLASAARQGPDALTVAITFGAGAVATLAVIDARTTYLRAMESARAQRLARSPSVAGNQTRWQGTRQACTQKSAETVRRSHDGNGR